MASLFPQYSVNPHPRRDSAGLRQQVEQEILRRRVRAELQRRGVVLPSPSGLSFSLPRDPPVLFPAGVTALTPKQSEVFYCPARFRVLVAGRRSGKSYMSIMEAIRAARTGKGKNVWIVGPSYRQIKQILWTALKSAIPPEQILTKSEVDLSLVLKGYESTIALRSANNPDSLRGSGLDLVILDEFSDQDPRIWTEVLRPALADRKGHAILQGTPRGYNHLHDLYVIAADTPDWAAFKFSTLEAGLVSPEEIESVKATLDPRAFAQEFDASFEQSTNRVYLHFSREIHVRGDLQDHHGEVLVGIDFNVNPMSAVIAMKIADQLHVIDEVEMHNSGTQELAQELQRRYPQRRLIAYPDPSGNARKTSASATDFTILRQFGIQVFAPSGAYASVDKVNTVNALLCNAKGERRLFIHSRCKRLIECLDRFAYKEGTGIEDRTKGYDHLTDGLAYLSCGIFPLTGGIGRARIQGV